MRASGLVAGGLLLAAPLAAQGFEGTVSLHFESGDMVQHYKAGKVRMEGGGMGEGWMLMEGTTMKIVAPQEKMVILMDAKGKSSHKHDGQSAKVTDLGTTETIAGKSCKNWLIEDKERYEICAAKGMGYFMFARPGGPMGRGRGPDLPDFTASGTGAGGGGAPEFLRDGFFPLRMTKLTGAKREVQMEVTKIEPKTLDAAMFEIPTGYKEMTMPGMPGM
jgi:hypothetical protein